MAFFFRLVGTLLLLVCWGVANAANTSTTLSITDNSVHVIRGTVYNHYPYLTASNASGSNPAYNFTSTNFASSLSGYVLNSDGTLSGQFVEVMEKFLI